MVQVIDFGDKIDFTPISSTEQDELSCNWDDIPLDGDNLVIKVPPHLPAVTEYPLPLTCANFLALAHMAVVLSVDQPALGLSLSGTFEMRGLCHDPTQARFWLLTSSP